MQQDYPTSNCLKLSQRDEEAGLSLRIKKDTAQQDQISSEQSKDIIQKQLTPGKRQSVNSEILNKKREVSAVFSPETNENPVTARESSREHRQSPTDSRPSFASVNVVTLKPQNRQTNEKQKVSLKNSPNAQIPTRIFEVTDPKSSWGGQSYFRQQAMSLEPVGHLNIRSNPLTINKKARLSSGSDSKRGKTQRYGNDICYRSPRSPLQKKDQNGFSNIKFRVQQLQSARKSDYNEFHKELFQQKSMQLEDELYQTQTEAQRKEGTSTMQIALLTQQLSQVKTELAETEKREKQQRNMYEKILDTIRQEIIGQGSLSDSQIRQVLDLSSFQSILTQARRTYGALRDQSPVQCNHVNDLINDVNNTGLRKQDGSQIESNLNRDSHNLRELPTANVQNQLNEKNSIIKKYESQSKKFIQEITELQTQNDTQKKSNLDLKEKNQTLVHKINQLEAELADQKADNKNLQSSFQDQLQMIVQGKDRDIYEYQQQIKHLEDFARALQQQVQAYDLRQSQASSVLNQQATEEANHLQNENADLKEDLVYAQAEKLILQKAKTMRDQESQEWKDKRLELEDQISKYKQTVDQNLILHQQSTDRLSVELNDALNKVDQKNKENELLKTKLNLIKLQISKLEQVQRGELSRSRSTGRRGADFRFGAGLNGKIDQDFKSVNSSPTAIGKIGELGRNQRSVQNNILHSSLPDINFLKTGQQQVDQMKASLDSESFQIKPTNQASKRQNLSIKDLVLRAEAAKSKQNSLKSDQNQKVQSPEEAKVDVTQMNDENQESLMVEQRPAPNGNQAKRGLESWNDRVKEQEQPDGKQEAQHSSNQRAYRERRSRSRRQQKFLSRNRGQDLSRYLSKGKIENQGQENLLESEEKPNYAEKEMSTKLSSHQNNQNDRQRRVMDRLKSRSTSRQNVIRNQIIQYKTQISQYQASESSINLQNLKRNKENGLESNSKLPINEVEQLRGSVNNLQPLNNGQGWYYDLANDKLTDSGQKSQVKKEDKQEICVSPQIDAKSQEGKKCVPQPSPGQRLKLPTRSRNPLYQSIQCIRSPSQTRLEHWQSLREIQYENQSCNSNQNPKKQFYFGNVSPRKKLISNLLDEHKRADGHKLPGSARHYHSQNRLFGNDKIQRQADEMSNVNDNEAQNNHKCPIKILFKKKAFVKERMEGILNDNEQKEKRQDEMKTDKANILNKHSQSRVIQIELESQSDDSLDSSKRSRSQDSESRVQISNEEELAEEMEKLIYSLMNQNQQAEQKMASILNSKGEHDNKYTDVIASDSPLKKPADSNEPKNHNLYIENEYPSFKGPDFSMLKDQAILNQTLDPNQIFEKFEELYRRILQRDKKLYNIKVDNKKLKKALWKMSEEFNKMQTGYQKCDEQRRELLLQNKKFDCRLKQAQVILNNQDDDIDLQLGDGIVTSQLLSGFKSKGSQKNIYHEVATSDRKSQMKPEKEADAAQESSRRDKKAFSIKKSLDDIQSQKNQIRQLSKSKENDQLKFKKVVPKIDLAPVDQYRSQMGLVGYKNESQRQNGDKPKWDASKNFAGSLRGSYQNNSLRQSTNQQKEDQAKQSRQKSPSFQLKTSGLNSAQARRHSRNGHGLTGNTHRMQVDLGQVDNVNGKLTQQPQPHTFNTINSLQKLSSRMACKRVTEGSQSQQQIVFQVPTKDNSKANPKQKTKILSRENSTNSRNHIINRSQNRYNQQDAQFSTVTQVQTENDSKKQQAKKSPKYINGTVAQTKANYFGDINSQQFFKAVDEKSLNTRQDSDYSEDNKEKGASSEQFGDFGSSILEKVGKNTLKMQQDRSRQVSKGIRKQQTMPLEHQGMNLKISSGVSNEQTQSQKQQLDDQELLSQNVHNLIDKRNREKNLVGPQTQKARPNSPRDVNQPINTQDFNETVLTTEVRCNDDLQHSPKQSKPIVDITPEKLRDTVKKGIHQINSQSNGTATLMNQGIQPARRPDDFISQNSSQVCPSPFQLPSMVQQAQEEPIHPHKKDSLSRLRLTDQAKDFQPVKTQQIQTQRNKKQQSLFQGDTTRPSYTKENPNIQMVKVSTLKHKSPLKTGAITRGEPQKAPNQKQPLQTRTNQTRQVSSRQRPKTNFRATVNL